jgi:hypothetical protein
MLTLNTACHMPIEWARVPSGTREKSMMPNTAAAKPPITPAAIIQKAATENASLSVN